MLKAGLIGAGVGFILAIITALVTPFCNPCLALLLGLGVGVLAGFWERPATSGSGAGEGAKAGAIATTGNLIGQMIGAVANGLIVGPQGMAELYRRFDIPRPMGSRSYWIYILGGNCLCAVVNVALGAGMGALGGILWYQISSKNQPTADPIDEAP